MNSDLLRPLLAGLLGALVVYGLSRATRAVPRRSDGRSLVEYGPGYKLLAVAFFPISAFVTYAAAHASDDQKALAGLIAAAFWTGTVYLAYEFFFVSLGFDDEYIFHRSLLRGPRRIPWSAVADVRYSPVTQAFTIDAAGFGRVSVSPMMNGAHDLIERASQRLLER